jgi:hypothetical protein
VLQLFVQCDSQRRDDQKKTPGADAPGVVVLEG